VRASFGTTKYCNSFLRGLPCNNGDCLYLHELGDERDRFTKEEIQVLPPLLLRTVTATASTAIVLLVPFIPLVSMVHR
jgi:hypothetical protein